MHTQVDQILSWYKFAQCVDLCGGVPVGDGFARGSLPSSIKSSIKYIIDICCLLHIVFYF